jgi:hypothetical protein
MKFLIIYIVLALLVNKFRENRRVDQEWTTQRHWKYWVHKTQEEDKQS